MDHYDALKNLWLLLFKLGVIDKLSEKGRDAFRRGMVGYY